MKFSVAIATVVSALAVSASPILHKREIGGVSPHVHRSQRNGHLPLRGVPAEGVPRPPQTLLPEHQHICPRREDFSCYPRVTSCDDICKSPTGCTFGAVDFNYENKFNLSAIKWNKLFKSFDCALKPKPASTNNPFATQTTSNPFASKTAFTA
ncbi:hypothetical protein NM208_g10679 [Fusarium decemcellulare]|uniref:Uncharacterized protein n=1 Tax=Fusarium decemcellulare TaxID=57161 RepID=A0ACC1RX03_9HYPO|nr:hypothetical protein NM208_g10679 [Fusarium decemcellulare]